MTQKESREAIDSAWDKDLTCYVVELCKIHLQAYPSSVWVLVTYARALTNLSRFSEAEAAFDQAFNYSKGDKDWHSLIFSSRGALYKRRGDYENAEAWYLKAIEAAPQHVWNHVILGSLLFRRGDLPSAEERLRKAIEIGGQETDEAYFNLGGVLMAQECYKEARECYMSAIEIDSDYKWAKLRLRDVNKILKMRPIVIDSSVAEAPSE